MGTQPLLGELSVPREAPYYSFEFLLHDTRDYDSFHERNFPKISRLFALGLGRSMIFKNASSMPLDIKSGLVEKRFWWDFDLARLRREGGGGGADLGLGSGRRLGVFKMRAQTLPKEHPSLVPGIRGLSLSDSERFLFLIKPHNRDVTSDDVTRLTSDDVTRLTSDDVTRLTRDDVTRLTSDDVTRLLREFESHPACVGYVLYERLLHEGDFSHQHLVDYIVEVLFSGAGGGTKGSGQRVLELKQSLAHLGHDLGWGLFTEEASYPTVYPHHMRYPSVVGRLLGY